jgi:capsular exopolysaccharide synthesis family protein
MKDILNLLHIIGRYFWLVILTTIITCVVVFFGTKFITPKYLAEAQVRVLTATEGNVTYPLFNTEYATFLMNTYAAIGTNPEFLDEIANTLPIDPDAFPDITVEALPFSEILRISVEHSDAGLTAATANALVDILVEKGNDLINGDRPLPTDVMRSDLDDLEAELVAAQGRYATMVTERANSVDIENARQDLISKQEFYYKVRADYFLAHSNEQMRFEVVSVINRAFVPTEPISPDLTLNVAMGGLIGVVGGIILASVLAMFDNRLYNISEIVAISDLPVLASVPRLPRSGRPVAINTSSGEAFRRLRLKLLTQVQSQTLIVASAEPHEGRSLVVENLAISFVQLNKRVVIIDSDLRKIGNKKNSFANFHSGPTLNELLTGEVPLKEMLADLDEFMAYVIPAGQSSPYASELLFLPRMSELISLLEAKFDYVLIDTPDYLTTADAAILGRHLTEDGVIVLTRNGKTNKHTLTWMLNEFENQNIGVVGIVANFDKPVYRGRVVQPQPGQVLFPTTNDKWLLAAFNSDEDTTVADSRRLKSDDLDIKKQKI